jgi:hypothetical protein
VPQQLKVKGQSRLADHGSSVLDQVRPARRRAGAWILISIAMVNLWNRLNVTTRQVAGADWSEEIPGSAVIAAARDDRAARRRAWGGMGQWVSYIACTSADRALCHEIVIHKSPILT